MSRMVEVRTQFICFPLFRTIVVCFAHLLMHFGSLYSEPKSDCPFRSSLIGGVNSVCLPRLPLDIFRGHILADNIFRTKNVDKG